MFAIINRIFKRFMNTGVLKLTEAQKNYAKRKRIS